jgi:hypothetical protein
MPEPPFQPRPAVPDLPGPPHPGPPGQPRTEPLRPAHPVGEPIEWRVARKLPALKLAAAAVIVLAALGIATDSVAHTLGAIVAIGLALWAARDLAVPVRLAADIDGVTLVTGVARRHRLGWKQIERVRVDERQRRGVRSELLELDAGDVLHLFSSYDLGVPPQDAAEALEALHAESQRRSTPPPTGSAGQAGGPDRGEHG